jgi:hypothetical protein
MSPSWSATSARRGSDIRRSPTPRAPLAISLLKEALRLDGAGKLRWRVRPAEHFKNERSAVGTQAYFFTADKAVHAIRTGRWPRAKPK